MDSRSSDTFRSSHTTWSSRLLLIVIFLMLFANIRFNVLHTVSQNKFLVYQADSQALAEQKILEVDSEGRIDAARGFLVKSAEMEKLRLSGKFPEGAPPDGAIYRSQFGLQGFVGSLLARILPVSPAQVVHVYESLMAAGTAGVLVLLLAGLMRSRGMLVTVVATLPFLFNPILVSVGRNLYWALPLIMLPLVVVWRIYEAHGIQGSRLHVGIFAVAGLVFLKCLCGYEYITCLCLAPAVALTVVWAAYDFENTGRFIRHAAILFLAACIGFAAAMIFHFVFVWWAVGDFQAAIDSILARATQHIAATGSQGAPIKYQHGIIGLVLMIIKYLTLPGIFLGAEVSVGDGSYNLISASFVGMFLFVIFLSVTRMKSLSEWRLWAGPALVVTAGLLASISWLIAARGHSLNHFHLNSMAFLPLILSFPLALFASGAQRSPNSQG